jgi:CheY-like chemotaxis protein
MPGMQGLDFVKKAKVNFPDTPYYLLTGFDLSEKIAAELQKGIIKGCLQNPFDKQEIEEAIRVSICK